MEKHKNYRGILATSGPYEGQLVGYIYKITNTVNGALYIGQTRRIPSERWDDHLACAKSFDPEKPYGCRKLYSAMCKYGIDKFTFMVLVTVPTELVGSIEALYVSHYNTIENGYNILPGGDDGYELNEETKALISQKVQAALIANPDKDRKNPKSMGLPQYVNYRIVDGNPCYVIEHHPKLHFKAFNVNKFASEEEAKAACLDLHAVLEKNEVEYKSRMDIKREKYPIGIRPAKTHEGRALYVQRGFMYNGRTRYIRKTVFDQIYDDEEMLEEAKRVLALLDSKIEQFQNGTLSYSDLIK